MSDEHAKTVLWTAEDAAAATNGNVSGQWQATGVSIDSRTVTPGDLFVALQGPSFDGHAFVAGALAAGAVAAVVSARPDGIASDAPLLLVEDTMTAMGDLGHVARMRAAAKVAGITGSVGKTGSKETLRHVLADQAPTYATTGSLNNHWGVPLSLARLPADAHYGVFELGMNHAGELGPLSRQVIPDVALITTVEAAHLEFFASVEAIADAKAEIFEGMQPTGVAVLNRDNPHYGRLLAAARTQGLSRIWGFGGHADSHARLISSTLHPTCSAVTAEILGEKLEYCLALPGRHWVMNSLGILLTARALGADLTTAARSLATLKPVKGRGTRRRISGPRGTFTLIDESYNASPAAMAATLEVLGRMDPGAGGRRISVLGDMRELGTRADALHVALAEPLKAASVDLVFACGPHMRALFERLPADMRGEWRETAADLAPVVAQAICGGDIVLVKGSAGSRAGQVVDALNGLDSQQTESDKDAPKAAVNGNRG